jgi:hypothetical protein
MTIPEIVANIDRRLAELETELLQLTSARAALADEAKPAAVSPPRRRASAPAKPAYDVVPAGKLVALLSDSDGMRTRQLAQASNGDPGQVLALLKEQEDAGEVRRSGTRAATRWHAITDEDRVAARAAELEAAGKRTRARKS